MIGDVEKMIEPSIFRAYDIRGVVGETLFADNMTAIGLAFASLLPADQRQVVVAYDGRQSSLTFDRALCEGLLAGGCDVTNLGCGPTPMLYYATHHIAPHGLMITGSHNPAEYNGLKMVVNQQSPSNDFMQKLCQLALEKKGKKNSQAKYWLFNIKQQYIDEIKEKIILKKRLRVVVDCGNGAAGELLPALLTALGCEVIPLFCEIDGRFPNHHPDPSQPENMVFLQDKVLSERADIGLALDGDGDRLGVVTDQGQIIWPDRQMMLYARDVLERSPGSKIIYDIKCSRHLTSVIEQYGGQPLMWKTGHSHIKRKMIETNAALAGEMSGHIFFNDDWYGFDDALYTAARLLSILDHVEEDSHSLFSKFPDSVNTPELRLPISDHEKFEMMDKLTQTLTFERAQLILIDGIRVEFDNGWGLIRASNTSPALILRFEADSQVSLETIQQAFRQQLLAVNPQWVLPF